MNTARGSSGFLRAFRLSLTVEGLRPSTIEHYTRDAARFVRWTGDDLKRVRPSDVNAYAAELQEEHAEKTVREA